ncbi:MAG: preprotein translocase subunit SecY [Candidatus Odinarchaeota archaeon]|nr:preprotein translocase subunit SecY [Candidatus Odinarchaeota archaeon]
MVRFIEIMQPLMKIMPEVKNPDRKVSFKEKAFWTILALILYLIMAQIPLYGIPRGQEGYDFLFYLRAILASNRGTLMELGIGPIVTAGLIMQLLVGSQIIHVDYSDPRDRALFTGSQKVLAVLIILFQSAGYIVSGTYGTLSTGAAVIVFLQLFAASIILLLLDEMIQKGWGLGSGVSLFIAANVSTAIFWGSFSPFPTGKPPNGDNLYRGAVIAFIQLMVDASSTGAWVENLNKAFFRPGYLPDMTGLLATIIVFLGVVYVESMRVELPVVHTKYRGFKGKYPIKLLYTSNIPVILVQALYANILLLAQLMWRWNSDNFWVQVLLGNFKLEEGRMQPIGGLVYYLTPPQGIDAVIQDPIRAAIYVVILTILCGVFSLLWVEVAGLAPRDVAKQLLDAQVMIPGYRPSIKILENVLNRYIPPLAIFGGLLIGILAGFADFLGAIGSGIGVLLTVDIIYQYYQILAQEQLSEMHPSLRGLLGVK